MRRLNKLASTCLLLILALRVPLASAEPWDQDNLMKALSRVKHSRVHFTETRFLSALKTPLVTRGSLVYQAPNRLEKHVTEPFQETTLIVDDRVSIDNKTQPFKRSLDLKSNPPLWAFVESFRATLAGDMTALERFYKVRLDGSRQQWQLTLLPRDIEIAELIRSIVVDGNDARILRITTQEADGDRSVLTLTELPP